MTGAGLVGPDPAVACLGAAPSGGHTVVLLSVPRTFPACVSCAGPVRLRRGIPRGLRRVIRAVPVCGRPALVLVSQARGGPSGAGAFVTVGPQEDARVRGPVVPGPVNRWDQQVLRAGFGAAGGCGHVRVRLRLRAPPFRLPRARLLSPCLLSLCLLSPCLLSPCLLTCGLLSCGLLGPRLPSSGLLSCGPLGPRWLCPRLPRGRLLRCRTLAAAAAFPPAGRPGSPRRSPRRPGRWSPASAAPSAGSPGYGTSAAPTWPPEPLDGSRWPWWRGRSCAVPPCLASPPAGMAGLGCTSRAQRGSGSCSAALAGAGMRERASSRRGSGG